jgi:hypothetical protein
VSIRVLCMPCHVLSCLFVVPCLVQGGGGENVTSRSEVAWHKAKFTGFLSLVLHVLSFLVLPYLVLSCFVLSCLMLYCIVVLSCFMLCSLIWPCVILYILCCAVLFCLIFSSLVFSPCFVISTLLFFCLLFFCFVLSVRRRRESLAWGSRNAEGKETEC